MRKHDKMRWLEALGRPFHIFRHLCIPRSHYNRRLHDGGRVIHLGLCGLAHYQDEAICEDESQSWKGLCMKWKNERNCIIACVHALIHAYRLCVNVVACRKSIKGEFLEVIHLCTFLNFAALCLSHRKYLLKAMPIALSTQTWGSPQLSFWGMGGLGISMS